MHAFLSTLPGGFCAMVAGYAVLAPPIMWSLYRFAGFLREED